jgi:hypothetical protein
MAPGWYSYSVLDLIRAVKPLSYIPYSISN